MLESFDWLRYNPFWENYCIKHKCYFEEFILWVKTIIFSDQKQNKQTSKRTKPNQNKTKSSYWEWLDRIHPKLSICFFEFEYDPAEMLENHLNHWEKQASLVDFIMHLIKSDHQ